MGETEHEDKRLAFEVGVLHGPAGRVDERERAADDRLFFNKRPIGGDRAIGGRAEDEGGDHGRQHRQHEHRFTFA